VSDTKSNIDSPDHQFSNEDARRDSQTRRGSAAGSLGVQREGLPDTYRMRADTHYVEHLTSRATVTLIRLIPIHSIDSVTEPLGHVELDPLIRSVKVNGVVQPLLVRKNDERFTVIAGRKRLAAAQFAGLAAVPCVVHQVSEAEAEALAEADNLRYVTVSPSAQPAKASDASSDLRRQLKAHLSTLRTATTLLSNGELVTADCGLDLVRAQTTRALWLLEAAEFLANGAVRYRRPRALASVVEQIVDALAPESRLAGTQVRAEFTGNAGSTSLESNAVAVGVMGAIVGMLPLVAKGDAPTITVRASGAGGAAVALEIAGTPVVLSEAKRFFDPTWVDRPGGWPAGVGARAARNAAEQLGGTATFLFDASGGAFVKLLSRPEPSTQNVPLT
jgi:hypothetical protein